MLEIIIRKNKFGKPKEDILTKIKSKFFWVNYAKIDSMNFWKMMVERQ